MSRTTRITAKEEAFCTAIASGKGPSEAYRSSYDTNASAAIVTVGAQQVLRRKRVTDRIQALRDKAARPAILTRQRKLERLAAMVEEQVADGAQLTSEQLKAVELDAKMQGHNEPEKLKIEGLGTVLQKIRKDARKP